MMIKIQQSPGFSDQKPGTSGLRKKVSVFQQEHYLAHFVQAILHELKQPNQSALVIGGDGRYYNEEAIELIIRLAVAHGVQRLLIGAGGLLSTPAVSHLIRLHQTAGGIVLSASHNPGGPDGDFGIKYNISNGGPAPESVTERLYQRACQPASYGVWQGDVPDLQAIGEHQIHHTVVQIVDSVSDYADLMETLFDFDRIRTVWAAKDYPLLFDAMHAVTGPYAREILINRLGAPERCVLHAIPQADFAGGHPDPNLVHAHELVARCYAADTALELGAASDGDGDRNMILGRGCFVTPSDSLAMMLAHARAVPAFRDGVAGVARSMPTSMAVDRVAESLGIPCYETPTGWKFFGNLLDAGRIQLCGEESFGHGSDHVREKDGLWAVLFWMNLVASTGLSVAEIQQQHWQKFGRHYYQRHDYEAVTDTCGQRILEQAKAGQAATVGRCMHGFTVSRADEFSYHDPVDGSVSTHQGLRWIGSDGARIMLRASGTGTQGMTLRLYLEQPVAADADWCVDVDTRMKPLIAAAEDLLGIHRLSGREAPDVVT